MPSIETAAVTAAPLPIALPRRSTIARRPAELAPAGTEARLLVGRDPFRHARQFEPLLERCGIGIHFLRPVERAVGNRVLIDDRELLNYSGYNYLGYSGDARVASAAKAAIDHHGTSVSASRLVAGQRPLHQELEREIASLIGTEDCVTFASGHATNVTTIGCLFEPKDLILYDVLCHNSIQEGIRLSGARRFRFPHNNVRAVEALLQRHRGAYRHVLIVTEGIFSVDGDIPPVPELIEVKRRHGAFLMVDEAHSIGVLGRSGRGVVEHFGLDPGDVDLWMGTLSKAFASCGGYIAGRHLLVESLRYAAPGFVYACGISPANAAAALEAARLLRCEPERVARLIARADRFREQAARAGIDTGLSQGGAVVPAIVGESLKSIVVADLLFRRGILVHPLFYPVVPKRSSRLRFFLTAMHAIEEIDETIRELARAIADADSFLASLGAGVP
jgi:8-amino-7-oxononanoate synthase